MSTERADDTIVTLRPEPNGVDAPTLEATPNQPDEAAVVTAAPERPVAQRRQSRWLLPVATGTAGVIASATLGGFLFWTVGQRDMPEVS